MASSPLVAIGDRVAHPASCTMGTEGPFPGGKTRPGRDSEHSPHLVPRSFFFFLSFRDERFQLKNRHNLLNMHPFVRKTHKDVKETVLIGTKARVAN
jgi:hypothetical protein